MHVCVNSSDVSSVAGLELCPEFVDVGAVFGCIVGPLMDHQVVGFSEESLAELAGEVGLWRPRPGAVRVPQGHLGSLLHLQVCVQHDGFCLYAAGSRHRHG